MARKLLHAHHEGGLVGAVGGDDVGAKLQRRKRDDRDAKLRDVATQVLAALDALFLLPRLQNLRAGRGARKTLAQYSTRLPP